MAIQGNYDISTAGGAYKAWYNYNYGGNTLNVSAEDIGEIQDKYAREIATTWAERATNDNNKYELTDDEKTEAKNSGEQRGKDVSEHDGSTDGTKSAVGSTASAIGALAGAFAAIYSSVARLTSGANATFAGTQVAAASGGLLLASALYLNSNKPNSEQAAACEKLTEEMGNAQGEIAEQDSIMEAADEELQCLSEEAEELNEETNDENEEAHADFSIYKEIYDTIMQKVQSGEPLTQEEKDMLKEIVPIMQELGIEIQDSTEETSEEVNDIYDEMGEQQDTFDTASEKIEEINGLTDFAAEFDEATKDNAKMVKTTSDFAMYGAAGAVTSGTIGIVAGLSKQAKGYAMTFGGTPLIALGTAQCIIGGIAVASGTTAGIMYKNISNQQDGYAQIAETEIAAREATQDLNSELTDVYDERVEDYEGYLGAVEDLELEVPDDLEVPEEDAVPESVIEGKTAEEVKAEEEKKEEDKDKDKDKDKDNNVA